MWKNVRIGVKLTLGFGLVVVVLATLGVLSFVLFGSLDRHVTSLTDRSLAAAKNSAQLQRAAFAAVVSEIQYLVDERAETAQATREKLAAALVSLDDIQRTAEQLQDEDLAKRIREVRARWPSSRAHSMKPCRPSPPTTAGCTDRPATPTHRARKKSTACG